MSSRKKRKSRKLGRPILILTNSRQSITTVHVTTALKVALVGEADRLSVSLSLYVAGVLAGMDPQARMDSFAAARAGITVELAELDNENEARSATA